MNPLSAAELGILDWIAAHFQCGWMDQLMPAVSWLGNTGLIFIIWGVALLALGRWQRNVGFQILMALVLSAILCNLILKNAVGRIRPFDLNTAVSLLIPPPDDPSFPSGHSSAAFATAVVLLLTKTKGRWVALVLAFVMAFSRLYLYVHFPTDVLCGILLGSLCGWLAVHIWRRYLRGTALGRELTFVPRGGPPDDP